jgi:hypothetical protein
VTDIIAAKARPDDKGEKQVAGFDDEDSATNSTDGSTTTLKNNGNNSCAMESFTTGSYGDGDYCYGASLHYLLGGRRVDAQERGGEEAYPELTDTSYSCSEEDSCYDDMQEDYDVPLNDTEEMCRSKQRQQEPETSSLLQLLDTSEGAKRRAQNCRNSSRLLDQEERQRSFQEKVKKWNAEESELLFMDYDRSVVAAKILQQ